MSSAVELRHKYPWKKQELITLAVLALAPIVVVGLLAANHAGTGTLIGTGTPVAVFCWGMGAYAYHLGSSRKRKTVISGELSGTRFSFVGGRFKRSAGDLAAHQRVSIRNAGPEQALVFSTAAQDGPDDEVLVPLRLIRQNAGGHDDLARVVRNHGLVPGMDISREAREVLEGMAG